MCARVYARGFQAEKRRELRRRALLGDGAVITHGLEGDSEAIERRVRASYASGSISCPMMGLRDIPRAMRNTFYAQVPWLMCAVCVCARVCTVCTRARACVRLYVCVRVAMCMWCPSVSPPPQFGCLSELYLADNQLTTVPFDFLLLIRHTLTVLVLKRNHISSMPPELGYLTRLTRLDLSENRLYSLPVTLTNLTNMTEVCVCVYGVFV